MNFPHIEDTRFPDIETVNVYDYQNTFDYSRFDNAQMHITLCRVPWDMGEVHIGQRVIGGIGNVVYFDDAAARDAWFAAIPDSDCIRFSTKYRALHRDNQIDLPITFEIASLYNYVAVEYVIPPNPQNPVEHAEGQGIRKWFWFVREVEFRSVNTTRLHILPDTWQTFIYDMHITRMTLDRGHAPMFETRADEYLQNPEGNCKTLLAPDVDFGGGDYLARSGSQIIYNSGDMYALIVTKSNPGGNWGVRNDTWRTPDGGSTQFAVYSQIAFVMDASDFPAFITNMKSDCPQFAQTVSAVCFVSKSLVGAGTAFEFCGISCNWATVANHTNNLLTLDKSQFGYDSDYADMAKLYTSPYAHIEISDGENIIEVAIEDTKGTIDLVSTPNLVWPWLQIDSHLKGIGTRQNTNIFFSNITSRSLPIGGNWYQYLMSHKIPCFAMVLGAGLHNSYNTYFDRQQMALAKDNSYTSEVASATTAQSNANAAALAGRDNSYDSADTTKTNIDVSASADKDNSDRQAATTRANATLQVNANNGITGAGITKMNADATQTQSFNTTTANMAIANTGDMATSQITATNQQAAISAGLISAQGALSSFGALMSGDAGGAMSNGLSATFSSAATLAGASVGVGLTAANAIYHAAYTGGMANAANTDTSVKTTNAVTFANAQLGYNNTLINDSADNVADTIEVNAQRTYNTQTNNATRNQTTNRGNALRSYNAQTANATRSYNTDVANAGREREITQGRIDNQIKQADLDTPFIYGNYEAGEHATTRPLGVFANIVTQSRAAIAAAGDEFLRYGYRLGQRWNFTSWHYGRYFTYWKLSDFWVQANEIPDLYMDRLRMFFLEGVTIWRRPEDIGAVDIYENFNEVTNG